MYRWYPVLWRVFPGNEAFKAGKWKEAVEGYTKAIDIDPDNKVIHPIDAAYLLHRMPCHTAGPTRAPHSYRHVRGLGVRRGVPVPAAANRAPVQFTVCCLHVELADRLHVPPRVRCMRGARE